MKASPTRSRSTKATPQRLKVKAALARAETTDSKPRRRQVAKPESAGRVSSVGKALLVLECVGLSQRRTLTEIAQEVRLPKSTLLRLIQVLVAQGFLRRTAHGEYAVSLKLWRIGCNAVDSEAVRDEVLPLLRDLVESTGETAHYAVYEEGHSMYVEKVDGLHPIRAYTKVGGRSPAYATATGKALLAWREADEIAEIGRKAQRWTETTHLGSAEVARDAAKTRSAGFAVNRGEWRASVWGIAAPVFDRHGKVVAAVGISGPRDRVEPNIDAFAHAVQSIAADLSSRFGATPRMPRGADSRGSSARRDGGAAAAGGTANDSVDATLYRTSQAR